MSTGSENNESIFCLFIPVAGYFAIFGNPADGAVYLDFLYDGKSEKTISCRADQSDGIKRIGAGKLAPILAIVCYNAV